MSAVVFKITGFWNSIDVDEVLLVQHVHLFEGGEEDVKTIGVYSTKEAAQKAIERLRRQPGFRDTPEGFTIDLYSVDKDGWEEGHVTVYDGREPERNEKTI